MPRRFIFVEPDEKPDIMVLKAGFPADKRNLRVEKGRWVMTIQKLITILDAQVVWGEDFSLELHSACGSDMMSDVLAYVKDQSVLLTGMVNPQVVRTAEMMDMRCIVFVRGKEPDAAMIGLAEEMGIVLLKTRLPMFTACGLLYQQGLRGGVGA